MPTARSPQNRCATALWNLLAFQEGQRWARQFVGPTGEPSYPHQKAALTPRQLEHHTAGQQTLGLVQDGHGGLCRFGALDLDLPRDAETLAEALVLLAHLQAAAAERGIPTLPVFSGRRGFHLLLPLARPMAWGVVHRALRRIARDVGLTPAELFPTRGKALKLACGIHGATGAWSVVLPALLGRSEAELAQIAGDLELALAAAAEGSPLPPDWESQVALLEAAATASPDAVEAAAGESTIPDLELLEPGEHPACIAALLEQGPRPDQTLNGENLNLARYAAQRELEPEEADAMATQLWELAPSGFTTKDLGSALRNFQQSFSRAQEGDSLYRFRCSDMVAGGPEEARKLVASGRCQGEVCPCWPWGSGRPEMAGDGSAAAAKPAPRPRKAEFPTSPNWGAAEPEADLGERHGRRLWRALQYLHAEGRELRLSLALAAVEQLPPDPHPSRPAGQVPLADALAERELLAAALGPHRDAVIKAAVLLSPAAFNAASPEPWDTWASALAADPETSEDVWRAHLEHLAEVALRVEAAAIGHKLVSTTTEGSIAAADALAHAAAGVAHLQRAATPDLAPADDHLHALVEDLLSPQQPRITVTHPGLRQVLGGGFRPGQLVAAGGPPGSGKTTWAVQLADEAAEAGIPALVLSMEMTRAQLMQATISRLAGIDGRELARGITPNSPQARAVLKAVEAYAAMAKRLYLVEGGPQHTPGRLQALVGQIRHQQGLPPDAPVLVVVDYLQLMALGVEGEGAMPETLRVGALATALKQLARTTGASVIALSDVTKEAMREAETGGRIGPGVFRDSARVLHACDTALVVQSGTVPAVKGKPAQNLLEVALSEPGLTTTRRQQLETALQPLAHPGDTYSRLTVIKNRGGQAGGEVWSLYRRHLSQYMPCLPGEADAEELREALSGHGF
jgi:replicative DNA helicase